MVQFKNCKLQLQLEAQMPMIHFQSRQAGATIRASEVKPKLDRFILGKIMEQEKKSIEQLKEDSEFEHLFLDADSNMNNALDYKMQITVFEKPQEIDLAPTGPDGRDNNEEKYAIFYANMGRQRDEIIYGLFSNPMVTIICFKEKLRKYIEEHIIAFFLVTNFGTMQNKGFGSFMPAEWCKTSILSTEQEKKIASYYNQLNPGCHCYAMKFEGLPAAKATIENKNKLCVKMSNNIRSFYSNMKSGQNFQGYSRSYLYQYMHNKVNIGNEKAWMKQQGISPNIAKPENEKKWEIPKHKLEECYYVRAFLGIGPTIRYAKGYRDNTYRRLADKVTITINSKKLERVSSPIFFKVIKNVVFIVAFEVSEELYDAEFVFDGTEYKGKKGKLKTPSKEIFAKTKYKFDIQDFMDEYVKYYNGDLRKKISINSNKKVVRIHA